MSTARLKIVLSFLIIVIFVIGGCSINMANSTPANVRILIGLGGRPYILIELTNKEVFEVTRFIDSWLWESELDLLNENFTPDTLVDDFILIDTFLCEMLKNPLDSPGFIVRDIISNKKVELSQQQWENVWNLVDNVAIDDADGAFELSLTRGLPYIWAIIDGRFYWSLYCRYSVQFRLNNPSVNRDLVILADELIALADVSPFQSGRR